MTNIDNTPAEIQRLTKEIRVLVEKGDHAKEKSRQFYLAAGLHLKTLKAHSASTNAWVQLVKKKCDLGRSRAFELLALADGRTTVEKVRADANKRKVKHRARPFRNGQPESHAPASLDADTTAAISRLAYRLIQLDVELARELSRILQQGGAARLALDLYTGIEIEESATNGGGADPGPIPDILRRGQAGGIQ
jgi:hypothetical protein